ncbi:methionine ABC transporter permease [Aeromonas taiwanensis]
MQSRLNLDTLLDLMYQGTVETLYMVGVAALFTLLLGLPIGVLLVVTRKEGVLPLPRVNMVLGLLINIGRSLPFVVLLIALIPLTRLLVGTTLGSTAAIVPITLGAFPFFARVVENALDEVDKGRVEAVLAMGGSGWHVVAKALLPEALPALLAGLTLTVVMLIGFSSMAGVIGGGGDRRHFAAVGAAGAGRGGSGGAGTGPSPLGESPFIRLPARCQPIKKRARGSLFCNDIKGST